MTVRIIEGDARAALAALPDESVHCVVTSPPYWGLRDYGLGRWLGGDAACAHAPYRGLQGRTEERPGRSFTGAKPQLESCRCGAVRADAGIGLEPTVGEHIAALVDVFRQVRRVLRKDGVMWLNYGDAYAGSWGAQSRGDYTAGTMDDVRPEYAIAARQIRAAGARGAGTGARKRTGLKPKDLIGLAWRLAFALQDDGWWLRSDCIWAKPNGMPESVADRPTRAHEYLFLFTRSARYFYDLAAIAEPSSPNTHARAARGRSDAHKYAETGQTIARRSPSAGRAFRLAAVGSGIRSNESFHAGRGDVVSMRNARTVWTIPTAAFDGEFCTACRSWLAGADKRAIRVERIADADGRVRTVRWCPHCASTDAWLSHFATFPPALVERAIRAGCPPGGTVLDPFGGAGTVGLVADRLQRDAVLIELNPDYCAMARGRIGADAGLLGDVA